MTWLLRLQPVLYPEETEPCVIPFARLYSRYSCRNILMNDFGKAVEEDTALYSARDQREAER